MFGFVRLKKGRNVVKILTFVSLQIDDKGGYYSVFMVTIFQCRMWIFTTDVMGWGNRLDTLSTARDFNRKIHRLPLTLM